MARKIVVRKNRYLDSVFLMLVARRIAAQPGIRDASALLATGANRKALAEMGYGDGGRDPEFAAAGPNDVLLALEGEDAAVEAVAKNADAWLTRESRLPGDEVPGQAPHSIAEAVARRPDASVAVISVPGEHAAREARLALELGLHVFLFSSNVSVEEERSLKLEALRRSRIVMGPDCGTAFLSGAGIGFANAVRRGPIGIVGSTGTGMQELASLLHQSGSGVSHGIGTGSRDLSDAIGGISTTMALDALQSDRATRVIVVLSKPPGKAAADQLLARLRRCQKPVVLCLLGADTAGGASVEAGRIRIASTLDEATSLALAAAGASAPPFLEADLTSMRELIRHEVAGMRPEQRHLRGIFAGGTLCYQSQAILRAAGLALHSNAPLPGVQELPNPHESEGDALIDMGAEVFVRGRPHPMIDATLRRKRLEREAADPTVAVVLLDFILGAIAARDPVGDMLGAIREAQETVRRRGGHLCVVASVCGTDDDAQGLNAQRRALEQAGAIVLPTSAQAAAFCRETLLALAAGKEPR